METMVIVRDVVRSGVCQWRDWLLKLRCLMLLRSGTHCHHRRSAEVLSTFNRNLAWQCSL